LPHAEPGRPLFYWFPAAWVPASEIKSTNPSGIVEVPVLVDATRVSVVTRFVKFIEEMERNGANPSINFLSQAMAAIRAQTQPAAIELTQAQELEFDRAGDLVRVKH
jgi:hypothetical protein